MDLTLRKRHWIEWITKRLSGNTEVDKETINFGINNFVKERDSLLLDLYGVGKRSEPLPKRLSNEAYKKAKTLKYEEFVKWWDSQV